MGNVDEALALARRGWRIIPLTPPGFKADWCKDPGKRPMIRNWPAEATTDEAKIRGWWDRYPDANFGIKTGEESGIVVLDVDPRHGGDESLKGLEAKHGKLPDTPQVLTGGGGVHYYFRYPTGRRISDRINLAPGLDFRGDGGQVVVPPSIHPNGRPYEWECSSRPEDVPLADMPEWLLDLIDRPPWSDGFSLSEVIAEGARNDSLFRLACWLRSKDLSEAGIMAAIEAENKGRCVPPLPPDELVTIAKQAAKYAPSHTYTGGESDWPEPEEIRTDILKPVSGLPADSLPDGTRPWLEDVALRMQCPLDFVAVGAIVVASSVVGARCSIKPMQNDDWEVIPNLWGGIVGKPSVKKSPALTEILKPLDKLEITAGENYDKEVPVFQAKYEAYKARQNAIKQAMITVAKAENSPQRKKSAETTPWTNASSEPKQRSLGDLENEFAGIEQPQEPSRRRFKTNDSTVEKLGEMLSDNPGGILVFRDELVGLLTSWEREDRQTDRAFFLESWNGGQSYTTDRIGRGTIDVKNCCLSILGGIQPARLTGYLLQATNSLQNDGMIQRFQLMVYPDEPAEWKLIDQKPDFSARNRAYEIYKALSEMDFVAAGAQQENDERPYFRFDAMAQELFFEWLPELEAKIRREEHSLMAEHLAKFRSLVPSLALVFHLIGIADGGTAGPVSVLSAAMACELADYLETHARRIYGLVTNLRFKSAAALAIKILDKRVADGFSERDVYRNEWHLLTTKELVSEACSELIDAGWLCKETKSVQGQQAKTIYRINPKIFSEKQK